MGARRWKLIALVVVVAGLFAAGRTLPLEAWVEDLRGWIDGLGWWGPVAFGAVYVAATVLALPGSPLSVVAGALFGAVWGTVLISIASTAGAALAFLVARYVARDTVREWLAGKPKFQRLDRLTEQRAATVVAVTRLIPLFPFNLLNYGFGLTRVPFGTYVVWSWLCMLPGTVLYVAGTDAVVRAVAEGRVPWGVVAGVAAVAVALVAINRRARARFDELDAAAGPPGNGNPGPDPADCRPADAAWADSAHDATRRERVHPDDWPQPEPPARYNLVVIGAGTAGLVAAAGAAGLGAKVALIERHEMGGDCLNTGCVPSKGLLRAARAAADVRRAEAFGVRVPDGVRADFAAAAERMRSIRAGISEVDAATRFRDELGVDVYFGQARFVDGERVTVGERELRFHRAVIATGARAAAPPIPGLAEAGFLTNDSFFDLAELPRRLAVIGGGPIGCELAQAAARFGAAVTLVEAADRIMGRDEPEAADRVAAALAADGVEVISGAGVERVEAAGRERVLHLGGGEAGRRVAVDQILVAAGRRPNVEGLGLEAAGVAYDRRGVRTDNRLRTTSRRVYASGDVALPQQFTHVADAASRIVLQNALFGGRKSVADLVIPWVTYTDPEVAHVGRTKAELDAEGTGYDAYRVGLDEVDRALLDGDEDGFLEVLTERGGDRILGATMVSAHAGESIAELTLAMAAGKGLGFLSGVIHPYPTQAMAIKQAGDAYSRTRLTPLVAKLIRGWLGLWA